MIKKHFNYKNYRKKDLEKKMQIMGVYPLDIMVTGVTGAGKSTTMNSLFEKYVAKVGKDVEPETVDLISYELNKVIRFWDTPGLGDGISQDKKHAKKIIDLLHKTYIIDDTEYGWIDLVLVIIEGINRDMGTTYKLINDIIIPNFQSERILIAVNQCDVAMKGRHWNYTKNKPDNILKDFLLNQTQSIKRRIKKATGIDIILPIYYSAEYGYNIDKFLDLVIDNIPIERREKYIK